MELSRPWWTKVPDLHGHAVGVSFNPQGGFCYHVHTPREVKAGFALAHAAAQSLLAKHGKHVGWAEGEELLKRCKEYDLARKMQEAAPDPRPVIRLKGQEAGR